uniref:Hexosyltransferase n=1 Tax=Megaselia scalaris TaxID=36166 RepID=T1GR46_MEGSC
MGNVFPIQKYDKRFQEYNSAQFLHDFYTIYMKAIMKSLTIFILLKIIYVEATLFSPESYPLKDNNVPTYIEQLKSNERPDLEPINKYKIKNIFKPICENAKKLEDPDIRLTFIVKSKVRNFLRREAIRTTWGQQVRTDLPRSSIRTVFNLGTRRKKSIQDEINKEYEVYKDILQSNFYDTYFNNTLKTVMGIKWAFENCPTSDFFFFVDEDYFVATKNVCNYLLKNKKNFEKESLYMGYIHKNAVPYRTKETKWFVSEKEYPLKEYPGYAAGGAVLYSRKAIQDIFYGISYTQHFRFDDVFVGLVA